MSKYLTKIKFVLLALSFFLSFIVTPKNTFAETCTVISPNPVYVEGSDSVQINPAGMTVGNKYAVQLKSVASPKIQRIGTFTATSTVGTPSFTVYLPPSGSSGDYFVELLDITGAAPPTFECGVISVTNSSAPLPPGTPSCSISPTSVNAGQTITVSGNNLSANTFYFVRVLGAERQGNSSDSSRNLSITVNPNLADTTPAPVEISPDKASWINCGVLSFNAAPPGFQAGVNPCQGDPPVCNTAIGNISADASEFTGALLRIAIGIAGGLALIIMVRGAIKILMAAGDPQKIADGRDMMIAAVAGLLFLILSVVILRFLGTDILNVFV